MHIIKKKPLILINSTSKYYGVLGGTHKKYAYRLVIKNNDNEAVYPLSRKTYMPTKLHST